MEKYSHLPKAAPWRRRDAAFFAFVLVLWLPSFSQPVFWEREIAAALDARDNYYRSAGIDPAVFKENPSSYTQHLSRAQDTASPWFNLLWGCSLLSTSNDQASGFLNRALQCTEKDPGATWVLAVECQRYALPFWQEKCLQKLETLFLVSGAQSAPVIAQPLLYQAVVSSRYQDNENTRGRYRVWASEFDHRQLWSSLLTIWSNVPWNIPRMFPQIGEVLDKMSDSWVLQLDAAHSCSKWLFRIFMLWVLSVFAMIAFKYLPPSLHAVAEKLPGSVSLRVRLALVTVFFLSFISFGIVFLIWMICFIVWRHLSPRDKTLATAALVLFLLYPLGIRLESMLSQCRSPSGTLTLFKKVVDEGYSPELDSFVRKRLNNSNQDHLAHVAAAISMIKKGDVNAAFPHVRTAQLLSGDDPVVLLTAGNALYYSGDLPGARNAYQKCISLYPRYEPAYFNLGQFYFNSMETAKGMDYITQAARLNADHVNSFIKKNDENFSKEWPLIRQLIQPDYKAAYFWTRIFPRYSGSWETANLRAGNAFLGIPLAAYGVLSIVLFLLLIGLDTTRWSRNAVKKVFTCRLCQASICRQCKRGGICKRCFDATQHIRNENIRQRIMGKIQLRHHHLRVF
jgi:tetratricopeptide (TPR) repeat protein